MHDIRKKSTPADKKTGITDNLAVCLRGIRKEYRLYDSLTEQAIDVLGISKLVFWRPIRYINFVALDAIDLEVKRGERMGIIGRNGAGKTTLLKLITGNFAPTAGHIEINGDVQALMQTGFGFHGEFTGYENIRASLIYNGLRGEKLKAALDDVVEFCELGDFLKQPIKTYSLGMRMRLQFATATAIEPDIVIVDEVLGAGDAYFNAKSSDRMMRLAESGCTLLIVSHSMQQVLQFCQRVVWLDHGRIIEDNEALPVIKAYERSMFERKHRASSANSPAKLNIHKDKRKDKKDQNIDRGVSRWTNDNSPLFIEKVRLVNREDKTCSHFEHGDPLVIDVEIQSKEEGTFPCIFLVLIFNSAGVQVTWHLSESYSLKMKKNETRSARLHFESLLLTGDSYVISAAIYESFNVLDKRKAKCYDLLSRSFFFQVGDDFSGSPAILHHPAHWQLIGHRE
jgi:lipopolysaccharide transport system ATP-binding protein